MPMGTECLTEIDFHSVTIRAMWQKDNAMLLISHNLNDAKNSPEQMNAVFLFVCRLGEFPEGYNVKHTYWSLNEGRNLCRGKVRRP